MCMYLAVTATALWCIGWELFVAQSRADNCCNAYAYYSLAFNHGVLSQQGGQGATAHYHKGRAYHHKAMQAEEMTGEVRAVHGNLHNKPAQQIH